MNFYNSCAAISNTGMPGKYVHIGYGTRRWSDPYPDSFALSSSVQFEGQALINSPVYSAMGARNKGLSI